MFAVNADMKVEISEETTEKIVDFSLRVLEPFGIVSDIISDNLTAFRVKNLQSIANKAKAPFEVNGQTPNLVSKKFLARFIEEASYEDDPDLQDMWANLLAIESIDNQHYKYINILKNLDVTSANILNNIYEYFSGEEEIILHATLRQHQRSFGLGQAEVDVEECQKSKFIYFICHGLSGDNKNIDSEEIINAKLLDRLGLIELSTYQGNLKNPDGQGYVVYAVINLLGKDFIETCNGKKLKGMAL